MNPDLPSSSPAADAPAEALAPKQLWLIPYVNPLRALLPRERMRELPNTPGVYFFYDEAGTLLYVGKSKRLRDRVNSYRYAKPGDGSRKTIRMIHEIRRFETVRCETEKDALLRENAEIRAHRPKYNRANATPELYHFLGFSVDAADPVAPRIRLRVMAEPELDRPDERIYGAFKNRGALQKAYRAIFRLLWLASQPPGTAIEYPLELLRSRFPAAYSMPSTPEIVAELSAFLAGDSDALLARLDPWLPPSDGDAPSAPGNFSERFHVEERATLAAFRLRAARVKSWLGKYGSPERWIEPARVDDLFVEDRFEESRDAVPR